MTKKELLEELYSRYRNSFKGREIVVGGGNTESSLLLVGEAPGKDEVRLSKPFVGAAGKNLNEFLSIVGIERDSIYITNAIKYRLSKLNEKTGRYINRPASRQEIEANRDYLLDEINILKPKIIITLGGVPLKSLIGDFSTVIGEHHGTLRKYSISDREYLLYPLYHPASIIYNRLLKDIYIEDIKNLNQILSDSNKN
ncbi:MAG: uracil-DNA glycosylase [Bacillota bacterium]|nr:uracil-DNA glycosylase [Bacillota bacterium]